MLKPQHIPVAINKYLLKDSVYIVDGVIFAGSEEAALSALKEASQYTIIDTCDPPFLLHQNGTIVNFTEKQLADFRRYKAEEDRRMGEMDAAISLLQDMLQPQ